MIKPSASGVTQPPGGSAKSTSDIICSSQCQDGSVHGFIHVEMDTDWKKNWIELCIHYTHIYILYTYNYNVCTVHITT